ncbi:MAG: DUF6715 family protein [Velocimicrobium sp.]
MKKTHRTVAFTIITMGILAMLIIWSFYNMTKKTAQKEEVPMTEVEKLIDKNIEENYPGTPRGVLKLYGRMTQCMYNEKMTEEQFEKIADQLRLLLDNELLENNERKAYLKNLRDDISTYHENEEKISSYEIQLGSATHYATIKEKEYATLKLSFLTQKAGKEKTYSKTYEQFLLRRNDGEKWKILQWKLASEDDLE